MSDITWRNNMNWEEFNDILQLARRTNDRDILPNQRKSQIRMGHHRPSGSWMTQGGDRLTSVYTHSDDRWSITRSFVSDYKDPILELGKEEGLFRRNKIHITSDPNGGVNRNEPNDAAARASEDRLRNPEGSPMLQQPAEGNEASRYGTNKSGIVYQQRLRILPVYALGWYANQDPGHYEHIYSGQSDIASFQEGSWNKANSAIANGLTYEYHDFDYSAPWIASQPIDWFENRSRDRGRRRMRHILSSEDQNIRLNPEFNFYSKNHDEMTEGLGDADYKIPSIFYTPPQDNLGWNFDSFTHEAYSSPEPGWVTRGVPRPYNSITSEEKTNFLQGEAQEKKLQYPWYIDMEITTPPPGPFLRSIKKRGLEGIIIKEISNQFAHGNSYFLKTRSATQKHEVFDSSADYDDGDEAMISFREDRPIASIDFYGNSESFFENIMTRLMNNEIEGEGVCNTYLDRISMLSVRSELNRALSSHQNHISFASTIAGTPCPTETLFYKIKKHHWSVDGTNSIDASTNNIYIANSKHEALKYIDTQVKRDRKYSYSISAYVMVYGMAYRYKHSSTDTISLSPTAERGATPSVPQHDPPPSNNDVIHGIPPLVDALVHYSPSVRIFEVPLYSEELNSRALTHRHQVRANLHGLVLPTLKILDRPPVPPNITILPYRGRNDEVLINLEENTESLGVGTRGYPWIPLGEGDTSVFTEIRRHQLMYENPNLPYGSLEFRGEGDMAKVEVYRTTKTPVIHGPPAHSRAQRWRLEHISPYSVFVEESETPYKLIDYSTQTAFKDTIKPNTPYYYTFRALDRGSPRRPDGYFSNPGPIYRVELVDNDGMIYALIDTYEPKRAEKPEIPRASLVRYLEIKPSLLTSEVGYDAPFDGTTIGLVDGEGSAFGKTFKVRIKSTDTGRMVDINMSFANTLSTVEREQLADVATPAPCPPPED